MLSDCGKQVFDVLPSGVVQHKASGLCMHPLWGGEEPEESQIVCLFRDCKAASRLKYLGYTSQEGDFFIASPRLANLSAGGELLARLSALVQFTLSHRKRQNFGMCLLKFFYTCFFCFI